jgi:hypothetical protein
LGELSKGYADVPRRASIRGGVLSPPGIVGSGSHLAQNWRLMTIQVSSEIIRLLNILSIRAHGSTQYELTVLDGVSSNVIYQAVILDLVYAHVPSDEDRATYRYYLRDDGRALLTPDDGPQCGD